MKKKLLDEFKKFALIDGTPKHERKVADYIKKILKKYGYKIKEDNAAKLIGGDCGNLIIKVRGNFKKAPPFLFLSHLDTVSSTGDLKIAVRGDIVTSGGKTILGADDRSAVAVMAEVLKNLKKLDRNHPDLYFIFTVAEEIGLLGAKSLDLKIIKGGFGFVLDTGRPVGTVVNKAPYLDKFKIVCIGKSAHAGMCPEYGVSAIKLAADAISKTKAGRIDFQTTCNFGKIRGGKAVNIVPDEAVVEGEIRSHCIKTLARIWEDIKGEFIESARKNRGKVRFSIVRDFEGFEISEDLNILKYTRRCIKELGLKAEVVAGGGGSDANVLNKCGIKSLVLGCGYEHPHSEKERIRISEIEKLYSLIFKLIEESKNYDRY